MQLAQSILRRSGIPPSSSAIAVRVAVALYGAAAIDTSRALTTDGELFGTRIVVREGLRGNRKENFCA